MKNYKPQILDMSITRLKERMVSLEEELAHLRDSSSEETKSSMGDKYETGREMIMQEQQKVSGQIQQAKAQLQLLRSIDPERQYDQVQFGAQVITPLGYYFISTSLGAIRAGSQQVFLVSAKAPVAQAMLGKKKGEMFEMNGRSFIIDQVI